MNFGMFAEPDRGLAFDVTDFDETLPGPFDWDLKRLAASFAVAPRDNGRRDRVGRDTARSCARSYRVEMARFTRGSTWNRRRPRSMPGSRSVLPGGAAGTWRRPGSGRAVGR